MELSKHLGSFFQGMSVIVFKITIFFAIALCILLLIFLSFFSETDESCKKHLGRVLSIWEERSVYENDVLEQLKQALCKYIIFYHYLFIKIYSLIKT